ncbi:MAG: hypothetical protein E6Q50_07545 [Lysobacter sp.]|nr:MAG: hypothetical protein E6Q50_07545 [Lysobacter sp.]
MNERIVLILGSALAALLFAGTVAWLFLAPGSEEVVSATAWIPLLRLALPAILAAALSAAWHSRGGRAVDCEDLTLASRIVWWSFPLFATILVGVFVLDGMIFADRVAGLASDLAMMSAAVFFIVMLASLVLFIPAFFVEYAVVRLVRSDRMRALLSGADS